MKFEFFLKSRLLFLTYSIVSAMFVNKYISGVYISKNKQCHNVKPTTYHFYVKTKILVDFHICISVTLKVYLGHDNGTQNNCDKV